MTYGFGTNPTAGRAPLDAPPLPPPDRLKPLPPAPGDDTIALLGAPNVNGEGAGISAETPMGIALGGVMKMMMGANEIVSVVPGAIPPPLMMLIQELMTSIPDIVRNMQQMTGPGGMLSTMGMSANPMNPMMGAGGMGAGAPMSTPPMGGGMGEGPRIPMPFA